MNKERYIKDVLRHLDVNPTMKKRIKEDLSDRIDEGMQDDPFFDVVETIGSPLEVANEFSENIRDNVTHIRVGFSGMASTRPYELKSKAQIFGLPLLHINTGGRYATRVAKGIIAIGDMSIGVISLGGVSFGLLSFGGIGIGILAIGGVALGGVALGGVAVGIHAIGAVAVGLTTVFGAVTKLLNL